MAYNWWPYNRGPFYGGGLYPGCLITRGLITEGIISGLKNAFSNALTENYFNTSLLTIHTECVSVGDKFLLY